MNYSTITPNSVIRNQFRIDQPAVLVMLSDNATAPNVLNNIHTSGLLLTNCDGLVIPNKMFTIGRKKFNGKIHLLDVKKSMLQQSTDLASMKKLKILASVPTEKVKGKVGEVESNKYYIYDATVISQAFVGLQESFPAKILLHVLLSELTNIYNEIKRSKPSLQVDPIIFISNPQSPLAQMLRNIRMMIQEKELSEMTFFDNYFLVNVGNQTTIPIFFKDKSVTHINTNMLNKVFDILDALPSPMENQSPVQADTENLSIKDKPEPSTFLQGIVKDIGQKNLIKTDIIDDELKVEIDKRELSKIFKKYKIENPDIIANVKSAIDAYVQNKGEKLTQDEAERTVLKAINFTIHGTDEVSEEYLARPRLLFNKLNEIKTYQVPLKFPNMASYTVNPADVIDIKHTCGQNRQQFEFTETIHENIAKLFSSIENVSSNPIKVVKIEHDVRDNDLDRYILYKITLQNMTGENKQPYSVELKVPAPVNERYFKLRGNHYIISTQQYFRPITKTDKTEVRILTNYAMIRIGIKNMKFNPSDVNDIINYMKIKYPRLMSEVQDNFVSFKDNSAVFFDGNLVYKQGPFEVFIDEETNRLKDTNGNEIKNGRFEYIYEILAQKILMADPNDKLTKTKLSIPYFQIHIMGIKLPLILYLWSQKGLLGALNDFGVDYKIEDEPSGGVSVATANNKFLNISPKNIREKLLVNGIIAARIKEVINDLTDKEAIYNHLAQNYGSRAIINFNLATENLIDPITKELLEFENLPTNVPALITGRALDMLLNQKQDNLADLKIYRARMSELILNATYKLIKQAHNHYTTKISYGDAKAKIEFFDPDYIITNILSDIGVLTNTEPVNPIDEIMLASKVIKTGKGGVPNRRAFKPEQRNIHESMYGIIGANSTSETTNVGLVGHHTLTPVITNKFGSYGAKDITSLSGWNILALDELLTPFQNSVDAGRMVMARTHASQITPVNNAEAPLVGTGAQFIVGQLASPRFVHRAKRDGVVTAIEKDRTMTVKYSDGSIESLDILPRLSRTRRGSFISLEMIPVEVGQKFLKNQIIARSKSFSEDGIYCSGKNVSIAVMNYMGYSHEDAYVVSQDWAKETTTDVIKEVSVIIPPETKILNMVRENKSVSNGETLVEFVYEEALENYLEMNNIALSEDDEEISNYAKGDHTIKTIAPQGEIVDIKIFINNKNSVDKSLLGFHDDMTKRDRKTLATLTKNRSENKDIISASDNMRLSYFTIGNHKHKGADFLGAKIVYYVKQTKIMREGDKIANRYGAKGVISKILTQAPKGEFTPRIDCFISPAGVFSRKNVSFIKELYIGKIFKHLNDKIIEMANDQTVKTETIIKTIVETYKIISTQKMVDAIKSNINTYNSLNTLRNNIKNGKFKLYYLIEPFDNIGFGKIKLCAEFLNIPLDEKVYIPELGTWTDVPVPVGVSYYQALEHYSDVYSNVRGSEKYQSLTRQPTHGKSRQGGQALGNLDVQALLSLEAQNILEELLGPRSDQHIPKRAIYNNIIEYGETPNMPRTGYGGTKDLFDIYMVGLGLEMK
jgi:hypothetical protein